MSQPVISGITPGNAPVGTAVVISGSGFSSTAADNIVNFGGIRVPVSNAGANAITVAVPYGQSPHVPVSVTTGGLTAYSQAPFITTFPGANGPFTSNSFQAAPNISTPGSPTDVAVGDLDLDGKIDFVAINANSLVSIYKNTSTTSAISFAAGTDINNIITAYSVALGDVDGDGLIDIIAGSYYNGADSISVYKNQSSAGFISFAPATRFAAATASSLTVGDVDGDGKPDMISTTSAGIFVFRNTSSGGIISFNERISFSAGQSPVDVILRDLNANGKPDVIVMDGNSLVFVLNNTSSSGNISFDPAQNVGIVNVGFAVEAADLDGDNKPEIAVSGYYENAIVILKNSSSSGGAISFAAPLNLTVNNPWGVKLADMNGDGKLDVVCPQFNTSYNVTVFRNTGNGSLSFDAGVDYYTGAKNFELAIADLRNTGLPDIITLERQINAIAIFKNKTNDPPTFSSFTPTSAGNGYEVTITGTNLSSVTAVSFGGVPAVSFNIVSSTSIKAMVGTGGSGDVVISGPSGSASQPGFIYTIAPAIHSFIPLSGPVGQVVKISGTNFSTTAANNIVYFGAVKAVVNSATATSLFVTVPAGATYQPISVTTNGYTIFSKHAFNTSFPDGDITLNTFIKKMSLVVGYQSLLYDISLADIDGDGLSDIITSAHKTVLSDVIYRDSFAVYRNTTVNGVISFANRTSFKTTGSYSFGIAIGDFNSDGKLDVSVTNQVFNVFLGNYAAVDIFRNTSTPGTISFAAPVSINAGPYPTQVSIGDLDGDGKPDFAVANGDAGFYVFKNACSGTTISFVNREFIPIPGGGASSVCISDLDGDNKPDVLASNTVSNQVAIFRNTSSTGTISLVQVAGYNAGRPSTYLTSADLDSDGKKDIIVAAGSYGTGVPAQDTAVIIGRNLSSAGNIAFDTAMAYPMNYPTNINIGDLDGDNKPDIVTSNSNTFFTILKNTSTPGNLSMAPIQYFIGNSVDAVASAVGDLDGDARPDILIVDESVSSAIHVYINQNGSDAELCPDGNKTLQSNITGGSYQWQLNTGSGFTNIINGTNYSGVNTVVLNLVNIPSSWYGNQYRCVVSGNNSKTFTIKFVNHWTGAVNTLWEQPGNWSCGTIPDSNTDVVISSGPVTLGSNSTIRSMKIDPDVHFTVNPGFNLTILH